MALKKDPSTIRQWQKHVEDFKLSGLTREAYSKRNSIRVYQLDYWRRKLSRSNKAPAVLPSNQWVPLKIADSPIEKNSHIDLWIGSIRVEVRHGFNPQLLAEILQVVGPRC